MTAAEILRQLNTLDEHHQIEAKRGTDVDRSFLETVCAFSNEPDLGGGWILLGAEKDESSLFPAYTPVGVSDPDGLSQKISTQCASMFNVRVRPQVRTEEVNGKPLLVVHVPEAPAADKPVYFLADGGFTALKDFLGRCLEGSVPLFLGRLLAIGFPQLFQADERAAFVGLAVEFRHEVRLFLLERETGPRATAPRPSPLRTICRGIS